MDPFKGWIDEAEVMGWIQRNPNQDDDTEYFQYHWVKEPTIDEDNPLLNITTDVIIEELRRRTKL
jgi:hypothetical protein